MEFLRYALEQDFAEVLGYSAALAAGFLLVLAVVGAAASRFGVKGVLPVLAATSITLALFVVGLTLFEAAALYLRSNGTGVERHGADRDDFVMLAKTGFVLVYLATVLVGAAAGYVLSRRRLRVALGVGATILLFLLVALPFAEFMNACNIGESVVLDASC